MLICIVGMYGMYGRYVWHVTNGGSVLRAGQAVAKRAKGIGVTTHRYVCQLEENLTQRKLMQELSSGRKDKKKCCFRWTKNSIIVKNTYIEKPARCYSQKNKTN